MKIRIILFVSLTYLLTGIAAVKSQDPTVREEINLINSLLKANPYRDTFLEITFYYSIDITPDKELIVNMDFDGPFKTTLKASLLHLNTTFQIDTALEGTSSICWYCKPDEKTRQTNCVHNESITREGEKESHFSDDICVMISRQDKIRNELIMAFDTLFKRVLEQ